MKWEETIEAIRRDPDYADLVHKSYLGADLAENVDRFAASEEFRETLSLLAVHAPGAERLLDIGSGNGISAVAFARHGFRVTAVEPDPSDTVGAGAIRQLAEAMALDELEVLEAFAEVLPLESNAFDIVYARQAMHHAQDLTRFIRECGRLLRPGGILLTVRDHVVFDPEDKARFLEEHPLQKFYGGENAYSPEEYRQAMEEAGLSIVRELRYFDSVINFYPELTMSDMADLEAYLRKESGKILVRKLGPFGKTGLAHRIFRRRIGTDRPTFLDERRRAGRVYSYIAKKS